MRKLLVLSATFITVFIGYSGWELLGEYLKLHVEKTRAEEISSEFFFLCVELGFVGYSYVITELIQEKDTLLYKVARFILFTTISTVIDRLFFDPYVVSFWDYAFLTLNLFLMLDGRKKIRAIASKIRQFRKGFR